MGCSGSSFTHHRELRRLRETVLYGDRLMPETVFPYPGGKTYMADWIIQHFPDHDCYVEPFGGGASVLVNKPESRVEVYNDRDGDIVQFFRVLREQPDELSEWLNSRPYAKDLHEKYGRQFHAGYRPDDPIERAGRFYYVRQTAFSGKYRTHSGFSSNNSNNDAKTYYRGVSDLQAFADRFRSVQVENRDYVDVFDRFDSTDTLFYLDPPYIKEGDALYTGDAFDHDRFVDAVNDLEGMWCVSYTDVPDGLDYEVIEYRDEPQNMSNAGAREEEYRTESLVMNYNPSETPSFAGAEQATLGDV